MRATVGATLVAIALLMAASARAQSPSIARDPRAQHVLSRTKAGQEGQVACDDLDADGRLEAWEIMRMKFSAEVVGLAACDTGRGRITGGEGVIGTMWALFAAGARSSHPYYWAGFILVGDPD
jgi:hypothetical protein